MATWDLQASAGATGKSLLWRGTWSSASSYNPYDAVYSGGSSYISKTNNANKNPTFNPSDWDLLASAGGQLRNYLSGLTLANNVTDAVNDINIAVGECRDDTNAADITIASAMTKQLDVAWAAGTAVGGRDTGSIADGTWHMFAIRNPTTGVCDVLFSLSVSAPTYPSGYTQKRRIGSVIRRAGSLIGFAQFGDYFLISLPIQDVTGALIQSQSGPVTLQNVPSGVRFMAHLILRMSQNTGAATISLYTPGSGQSPVPNIYVPNANINISYTGQFLTAPDATLTATAGPQTGTFAIGISVIGYWDYRGKQD